MSEAIVLTNDYMKGVMTDGLVDRGVCVNLDSDMMPGVYTTIEETKGTMPTKMGSFAKYAKLVVYPKRYSTIFQMLISENAMMAFRTMHNGSWLPWKEPILQ